MAKERKEIDRRQFLRKLGLGSGAAMAMMTLEPLSILAADKAEPQVGKSSSNRMTYRVQHGSKEQISLLGFGMMRLPDSQEQVNSLVDYAISHGVNYFDTAPAYKNGRDEAMTGIALSRYPRDSYYIATKMSNQDRRNWTLAAAKSMYEKSFRELQTDYIDYYLLHSVGGGGLEQLQSRFINNGLLDFLLAERKAGRIRHLGFSYHGDVSVFDWLIDHNEQYHWDFVQIQMNYLDWRHASMERGGWKRDADAEYLYNKLNKNGIQCVIMEPLRGGALSRVPQEIASQLRKVRPDDSPAKWAFRWVGSHPNVLTVLSGMNRMEHLEENVKTFSPLETCTEAENVLLAGIADQMSGIPTVPCTTCRYCMPCPFDVDIPGNFAYYNEAVNQHLLPLPVKGSADYEAKRKQFLDGYKKALPNEKNWATTCIGCEACIPKCPQQIRIPNQMDRIIELL